MKLKVNDDRLNWNEPVEVITFLPEEKELQVFFRQRENVFSVMAWRLVV